MKKPKTVVDAEAALAAKAAEVAAVKEALERLKSEWGIAHTAVRHAQTEADATLPQCRLVRIRWRSSNEEDMGRVVILRRTPGGMLVVRYVGEFDGSEHKFKWAEYAGKYRQAEKSSYTSHTRELRDVPAEYLPTASCMTTTASHQAQGAR